MTPEQVKLVQRSYDLVRPISETAAALFWVCLFDLNPGLDDVIPDDIRANSRKSMFLLGQAVRRLDRSKRFVTGVKVWRKRMRCDLDDFDYRTIRQALLSTLERMLGPSFTPETRYAWTEAYSLFASVIWGPAIPKRTALNVAT
jgi:nitric oxide dioxygenase